MFTLEIPVKLYSKICWACDNSSKDEHPLTSVLETFQEYKLYYKRNMHKRIIKLNMKRVRSWE
jgi:hypothetical protein